MSRFSTDSGTLGCIINYLQDGTPRAIDTIMLTNLTILAHEAGRVTVLAIALDEAMAKSPAARAAYAAQWGEEYVPFQNAARFAMIADARSCRGDSTGIV